MTFATRRPRGTKTEEFEPWLDEPADVARPMLMEIAAQPRLQFLPAGEGNNGRAANDARTGARTTAVLASIAAMSWLTGCSVAKSANDGGVCLQAAAGQSSKAPAPDDALSTEGGGLSHIQGHGRARDVVPVPGLHETAGAGGAASNQESTGADRAVRDRSGLVDAWPEVEPKKPDLTIRAGLSKG